MVRHPVIHKVTDAVHRVLEEGLLGVQVHVGPLMKIEYGKISPKRLGKEGE